MGIAKVGRHVEVHRNQGAISQRDIKRIEAKTPRAVAPKAKPVTNVTTVRALKATPKAEFDREVLAEAEVMGKEAQRFKLTSDTSVLTSVLIAKIELNHPKLDKAIGGRRAEFIEALRAGKSVPEALRAAILAKELGQVDATRSIQFSFDANPYDIIEIPVVAILEKSAGVRAALKTDARIAGFTAAVLREGGFGRAAEEILAEWKKPAAGTQATYKRLDAIRIQEGLPMGTQALPEVIAKSELGNKLGGNFTNVKIYAEALVQSTNMRKSPAEVFAQTQKDIAAIDAALTKAEDLRGDALTAFVARNKALSDVLSRDNRLKLFVRSRESGLFSARQSFERTF